MSPSRQSRRSSGPATADSAGHSLESISAAGYTAAAIGRSFGLSRTSVTRIVRGGNYTGQPG